MTQPADKHPDKRKPMPPGIPFGTGTDPRRGPTFGPSHQPRGTPWRPDEIAQLGTAPDRTIATRLGRSRSSVILKRRELGIKAHTGRGRPKSS